jgi:hypothetical protein
MFGILEKDLAMTAAIENAGRKISISRRFTDQVLSPLPRNERP